jgi:hypothetical protein
VIEYFNANDFLYYSAIGREKKERRVLFFKRNCVLGEGKSNFPRKYWISFYHFKTRKNREK